MEKEEKKVSSFRILTAGAAAGCGSPAPQFLDYQAVKLNHFDPSWAVSYDYPLHGQSLAQHQNW
jgi:hypothetical protein